MKLLNSSPITWLHCLATLVLAWSALAPAQAQSRYTYSTDGSQVTDTQTGLIWFRCTAGQAWNGSACVNAPSMFTHEAALSYAASQTGWRLPNVKELTSLLNGNGGFMAIDAVAFPGAIPTAYWTSTPYVPLPSTAWIVDFQLAAGVGTASRVGSSLLVRLVR